LALFGLPVTVSEMGKICLTPFATKSTSPLYGVVLGAGSPAVFMLTVTLVFVTALPETEKLIHGHGDVPQLEDIVNAVLAVALT
jgi:hypothetical protein